MCAQQTSAAPSEGVPSVRQDRHRAVTHIRFRCPCGKHYALPLRHAGRRAKCGCGRVFTIPLPAGKGKALVRWASEECPQCGKPIHLSETSSGRRARCTWCGHTWRLSTVPGQRSSHHTAHEDTSASRPRSGEKNDSEQQSSQKTPCDGAADRATPPKALAEMRRFQAQQRATRAQVIKDALLCCVYGAGLAVFCLPALVVVRSMPYGFGKGMLSFALLVCGLAGVVMVPGGLGWLLVSMVRPSKKITCPRCKRVHQVLRSVNRYMCTECGTLLLVGRESDEAPKFTNCSYCGLATAATPSHGVFLCSKCGIPRTARGPETSRMFSCPRCRRSLPIEILYCVHCGQVFQSNLADITRGEKRLSYDMYWRVGKDAMGHFVYAQILFDRIRRIAGSAKSLEKIQQLVLDLRDGLLSFDMAIREPAMRQRALRALHTMDSAYASSLKAELAWAKSPAGAQSMRAESVETLKREPHIQVRRDVERQLSEIRNRRISVGAWSQGLIVFKETGTPSRQYFRIAHFEGLRAEASRVAAWTTERSQDNRGETALQGTEFPCPKVSTQRTQA